MNRITALAVFVAATLMAAGSAAAQGPTFKINVPFSFTVNNTVLPPGTYNVGVDSLNPNMVTLRDRTSNVKATGFGERGAVNEGSPHTLIFNHYGDRYFLSQVRFGSAKDGIFLPANKTEQQARKASRDAALTLVAAD